MLAPAYDEDVCPHWAERWEIRTQPLGCQVSTITTLTSIISVVSSLVAILFVFVVIAATMMLRKYVKDKRRKGAWRVRWRKVLWRDEGTERDPLLPQQQDGQ